MMPLVAAGAGVENIHFYMHRNQHFILLPKPTLLYHHGRHTHLDGTNARSVLLSVYCFFMSRHSSKLHCKGFYSIAVIIWLSFLSCQTASLRKGKVTECSLATHTFDSHDDKYKYPGLPHILLEEEARYCESVRNLLAGSFFLDPLVSHTNTGLGLQHEQTITIG